MVPFITNKLPCSKNKSTFSLVVLCLNKNFRSRKEVLENINFENITNREEKEKIAIQIAQKVKNGETIGFGSGSTSYLAVKEISKRIKKENIDILAIPTSHEIKMLCSELEIPTTTIMENKPS